MGISLCLSSSFVFFMFRKRLNLLPVVMRRERRAKAVRVHRPALSRSQTQRRLRRWAGVQADGGNEGLFGLRAEIRHRHFVAGDHEFWATRAFAPHALR